MQDVKSIKSGRRRNLNPVTVLQHSSSYTPSFAENGIKTRKRSTLGGESSDFKENLGVVSLQSALSTSLPDLQQDTDMSRRVTPTHNTGGGPGRRGFMGFSNGPATSSGIPGAGPRRRHTVQPQVSLDTEARLMTTSPPIISNGGKKVVDFFDPDTRPSAPVRSSDITQEGVRSRKSSKHSATPNHMSLDNWLKSLPDTFSRENSAKIQPTSNKTTKDIDKTKELWVDEIEDVEGESGVIQSRKSTEIKQIITGSPISLETARDLKRLMFGGGGSSMFPQGWLGQAFVWNKNPSLSYGFIQTRGGPCGVMAAVQSATLKVLMFGSKELDIEAVDKSQMVSGIPAMVRDRALAAAITEVLVRAADTGEELIVVISGMKKHFTSAGRMRADGITETLNVYTFSSRLKLFGFLLDNSGFMTGAGNNAVICLLYSCLLTRGVDRVRDDMDDPDTALMAAHGYCSQEMVSLVTTGRAISNVFDGDVTLGSGADQTRLKGIKSQGEVGLLSLFEHYKSCQVGAHLKCPVFPIWLVCSESHFTVLWARDGEEGEGVIQLSYYDGLAGQDGPINLSVDTGAEIPDQEVNSTIEFCIRTKWTRASVSWNGAEKIL